MSRQPEPSGPHGLPMASLPLTQTQRNELDQTIHGALGRFILDSIEDPEIADMNLNAELIMVLRCVLFETSRVLKHNELVNVLEPPDFAKDIVERHPQLREMIRQACQTKSFSPIIDLKILQTDTSPPVRSELAQDDDELDRLHDSFKTPYIGKAVDGFYEYLKNNNNKFRGKGISRPYYAKFCSIVQSSGTGKSRLITELRTKGVLVLYMNLREPNDSGFPVRDPVPARILTEDMDCTQAEYTARCCVLFTAIFQTLQQNLSSRLPTLRSANADATIKAWNDEMCKHAIQRSPLPRSIYRLKSAEPATAGGTFSGSKFNVGRPPKLEGESYLKRAFNETGGSFATYIYRREGGETGKRKREEKRKDKALDDEPKLVIAFDEAHPLGKISSKNFRPSHILGRTINSYSRNTDAPVWVVFASTTSHVADFSVPQVIHDSLRVAIAGELLYPPYTDLGWDQHAVPLAGVAANDVATFLHVVGFGRPLWKTYVQNEIADGDYDAGCPEAMQIQNI
ncbi:hypothetical protein EDB19DRAFT_1909614 [Suillus lakei]|nr:hypothetical protein EDB19DRAFT_1909614 [Suillus lakei]